MAGLTFLLAFAVADLTGVRPLGGLVLVAGGAWCAWTARPAIGSARTAVLLLVALAAFVLSHPLGDVLGAWPAVVVAAAGVTLVATALVAPRATVPA